MTQQVMIEIVNGWILVGLLSSLVIIPSVKVLCTLLLSITIRRSPS